MMRNQKQTGGVLVLVLLVVLMLSGVGLIALRQTGTEMGSVRNLRVAQLAYQTAQAGLAKISLTAQGAPDYFHRLAAQANPTGPYYTFGSEQLSSTPPGVFQLADPFGGDTQVSERERKRLGLLEFQATMSRPRLAFPPPGFSVAGGIGNRFVFYVYQLDTYGWISRKPQTLLVTPGTAGARKMLRAEMRLGPVAINQ